MEKSHAGDCSFSSFFSAFSNWGVCSLLNRIFCIYTLCVCILCIDSIYLSIYHLSAIYLWVTGRISQGRCYLSWMSKKEELYKINKEGSEALQSNYRTWIYYSCLLIKIWSLFNGLFKDMLTWDKSFFLKHDCIFLKYKGKHKI